MPMLRWIALAVFAALAAIHVAICVAGSAPTNDDAFISFRYSRNLVEGHGLVFNVGERVEGYTNFLWVLLVAAAMKVTDAVLAAKVMGVLCNVVTIGLVLRLSLRVAGGAWWLAPLMLALDPSFATWSTRGLETSLFALLAFAAFATAGGDEPRDPQRAANLAVLATLARPEGLLVAMACGLGWFRRAPLRLVAFSATYVALLVPYLAWKLWYYGSVLPNTYYAKTGGGVFQAWRGLSYVTNGWSFVPLLFCIGIAGALFLRRGEPRPPVLVAAATVLGCFLAYVIQVGGDSLGKDRFLAPLAPFLFLATAVAVRRLGASRAWALIVLVLVLFVRDLAPLLDVVKNPNVWSRAKEAAEVHTRLGLCLKEHARPGASIATSLIGRVPFYSGLKTIDKLGLIDPHIAHMGATGSGAAGHEKFDPDYVLSLRPTYILGGKVGEVIVAPPPEKRWVRWLRQHVSGDPPQPEKRSMKPEEHGYVLATIPCEPRPAQVWELSP
ncbi:MAG: hypothetical protein U0166_25030 [Acidobacteriota bacterium]